MEGKAGVLQPHTLEEMVQGTQEGEMIHFNFFHIGTGSSLGDNVVSDKVSTYVLVLVEDVGGSTSLGPVVECAVAVTAATLVR